MSQEAFSDKLFSELAIQPEILRAVESLGFEKMTPIQAQAMPILLDGRDVIGQAQTGTGKTAAFGIPILQRVDPDNKGVQAVILCPTRELAVQAANELRSFTKYMHDVKVLPVYGGQDILTQIRGLKGVQIIVGTPGRVMDHMRRHTIRMDDVSMVVLDEADEMLNMGFREDMEVILGAIDHPHQTCLFSATMPQGILDITSQFQNEPVLVQVSKDELTISRIQQFYYSVKREYKFQALVRLLAYYRYHKCMVFCNKKSTVDELVTQLQKEGYAADALHGDLSQKQRDMVMSRFRERENSIMVATDIAARGIDVENVEAVFNYDIPMESEYYVHRIGRTGRAGRDGVSHTLCGSSEFRKIRFIEKDCNTLMVEKSVPTPAEINEIKETQVLEKVFGVLNEGHSGSKIPVVRAFCEQHNIDVEALAAAFLKMEIGAELEELEIDLPSKEERKKERRGEKRGRHRGHALFGRDFGSALERGENDEELSASAIYERRDRKRREKKDRQPVEGENPIKRFENAIEERFEQYREDFIKKHGEKDEKRKSKRSDRDKHFDREHKRAEKVRKDKSFPDKSDRKKNRERSKKVLERVARDIRMNGKPKLSKKKHRG